MGLQRNDQQEVEEIDIRKTPDLKKFFQNSK
jgi:hypothetical protein